MKNFVLAFTLLLVLSFTVTADDGTTHTGGKTCSPEQTCFVQPDNPTILKGKTVYKELFDFFIQIFI
jgi:hypothetical protein